MTKATSSNGQEYQIGSAKGNDFVNNAKAGSTMTGGDGSTWTKNHDGSTSITKNGTTYTVGGSSGMGGSSVKNKSGGSSGSSSSGTVRVGYSNGGGEYEIGSERGLGFLNNAVAGSRLTGSDGSEWVKNSDGSTTITKNGQTYTVGGIQNNATSAELEALKQELRQLYSEGGSYAQALKAQQAANNANVQKAVNSLRGQKEDTETSYADLFRQLYLNKMNAQKNIDQRLAAQGKTGGAAESTLLGLDTSYSDALRQGEQSRLGALSDLDRAITDAELTGDVSNAELAAESAKERTNSYADVLQSLLDRYDTQNAQSTAYEREDATNARSYAYNLAMQLLQSGNMASDELLESAGISKTDAQAMVAAVAAQKAANTVRASGNETETVGDDKVLSGAVENGYNSAYFDAAMRSLVTRLAQGDTDSALSGVDSLWGKLSTQQKQTVQQLLSRYGIAYREG